MTILPKKHKAPPPPSQAASASPSDLPGSGSVVPGAPVQEHHRHLHHRHHHHHHHHHHAHHHLSQPNDIHPNIEAGQATGAGANWVNDHYDPPAIAAGPSGRGAGSPQWPSSPRDSSPTPAELRPPSSAGTDLSGQAPQTFSKRRHRGSKSDGTSSKRHKSSHSNTTGSTGQPAQVVQANPSVLPECSNAESNSSSGSVIPKSDAEDDSVSSELGAVAGVSSEIGAIERDDGSECGYNSEDEYSHLGIQLTDQEWEEKDRKFEKVMKKKGFLIKRMIDDGSCLFRAVADQVYGDQEMHGVIRAHCMDYVERNADYFSQYMTEAVESYVRRKRFHGVHGNHLEIQALSEMYNRPIHIYCYSHEPINIFQNINNSDKASVPVRLSYHRLTHYNSIVDPFKPTIGVGLGLPGYSPGSADRNLLGQAVKASEETLVEDMMLEDKLKTTDWEATNEAIEEQVARESYMQWLRDNERRKAKSTKSATVTSGELRSHVLNANNSTVGSSSPKAGCSSRNWESPKHASRNSPKAGCSSDRDSPKPCSSQQRSPQQSQRKHELDLGFGPEFQLSETQSFLTGLPPNIFGLEDWSDTDVITQVLAASQQEYFDSLKKQKKREKSKTSCQESSPSEQDGNSQS